MVHRHSGQSLADEAVEGWMSAAKRANQLHASALNAVKAQNLFYKYTVTHRGVSKANTPPRHISTVRHRMAGKSSAVIRSGLSKTQSTRQAALTESRDTFSLAYHPLVDLTPFSAAIAAAG